MSKKRLPDIFSDIFIQVLSTCSLCGKTLSKRQAKKGKKYCRRCAKAKAKQKLGRFSR